MASLSQSKVGAETLDRVSKRKQSENFKTMISAVDVKKGWKILDMGCGTGADTVSLSPLIGEKGYVVGIDPIAERIEVARRNYQNDIIKFHVAYGKDAAKFGKDFDLVVSNQVMHLVPAAEKESTFRSIAQSLKPAGQFVFVIPKKSSGPDTSYLKLFDLISSKGEMLQKWTSQVHLLTEESIREIALEHGFDHITIKECHMGATFDTVDDFFQYISSEFYVFQFEEMYENLKEIEKNNDVTFLYNEQRKIDTKKDFLLVTCTKKELLSCV